MLAGSTLGLGLRGITCYSGREFSNFNLCTLALLAVATIISLLLN
jgi:hypothetical protein